MTQMTKSLERRLFEGDQAKLILENEAFTAAFEAIESEVIEQWKNSPARDEAGREKLWTYLQMVQKFKAQLTQTLETGTLARLELEHKQSMAERARGWLSRAA